ncbi:membrane protein FxsA [Corynebacterium sp. 13CS0277]|uniref:FxsA family protein n=1 Tax=Corynebacterium sp. 13CS0277 TaxID=2071994 RepID=UPI000D029E13|nr:FxsA family protein [Corynebacterium sp. 13CS0277]PRQ12109.1 membrane protein FxsA [Corynebacterium sp. 13CS0277]
MPLTFAIPYILGEGLAFYAVSRWIGTGWALVALAGFFFGGLLLAAYEMRHIAELSARGRRSPGQAAGELGLIAAGAMGVAIPGFITTICGLLLIISPTRVMVRKVLARSISARLSAFGDAMYAQAAQYGMGERRSSYGSFVIDAEEPTSTAHGPASSTQSAPSEEDISRWSDSLDPEDFRDPPAAR